MLTLLRVPFLDGDAPPGAHLIRACGLGRLRKRLRVRVQAGFFLDGLQAAREARGARRGDPRCQTLMLARAGQDRATLYDEITDKIIAELEAGRVPWVQPWGTAAARAPLAMPKNASTARQYGGINILILWGAVIE